MKKEEFKFNDQKYTGADIASWVARLGESNSRLHKEDVIGEAASVATLGGRDAEAFLYSLHLTYNTFMTFNVRQIPTTEGITGKENPWPTFWNLAGDLVDRKLTGNAARDRIERVSSEFDSDQWNTVCRPVLLKDLRVGISEKTINKMIKGTIWEIPVFSCQLAQDSSDGKGLVGKCRLEKKLDGSRMLVIFDAQGNLKGSFSRNGKPYNNFPHVEQALSEFVKTQEFRNGVVFDGEIMSESFQALMKQAQRKENVQTQDTVYHIFDAISLLEFKLGRSHKNMGDRAEWLESMTESLESHTCLHVSRGITVDLDTAEGKDQLKRYADDAVTAGYEGVMIKKLSGPYLTKRSDTWLKWKPTIDVDLTVVAVEEGTGKNEGSLGALVCEGVDNDRNIRVNVGSGLSDDLRADIWSDPSVVIGQTVVVVADAVTQNQDGNYSLRFPRFKTFREDK